MSSTVLRDRACNLSKTNAREALKIARKVPDPWYRAQALAWVARFTDGDPVAVAAEAAESAEECDDDYKRSAVRAWEIAALAERDSTIKARKSLSDALMLAKRVTPASSRTEAMFLLMQAAFKIDCKDAEQVYETLKASCSLTEHWRCRRALRDGEKLLSGQLQPRPFFW